ncbi:sigma-70 family RNA polymerase sigma factor [Micromonospora sp. PLK6-60]|uniref:RNA polymerase sigma factor n=1 Tax=Micromonospora sp. PLK6-60 TaxID=2873383 RepID=UPI001CA68504|nr:sigma-70 family RNA polymerase sigma factor [Micromonospora sp. PLK6-60]MBY8871571.1 sigma-70 family RNA polymerase sigma factor [Micromonospora sp. PLK6-60]
MGEREQRLSQLFRRHADDLYAYASWRVGRHEAADVVSEVFLVACRSLDRVRAGQERGWLFGVARNTVLARRRRGAAAAAFEDQLDSGEREAGVDRLAEDVATRDQVRRALGRLRDADRELLVTTVWFDLSPTEAARALGITRAAYAVRLHRARRRFREAYQCAEPAESPPAPRVHPVLSRPSQ